VSDFLEREGELAEIQALVDGASDGQGRMALIAGTAGIGKSRLLDAVVEAAGRAGARAIRARGDGNWVGGAAATAIAVLMFALWRFAQRRGTMIGTRSGEPRPRPRGASRKGK